MTHYTVAGILREQVPVLSLTVVIGLIAGTVLEAFEATLLAIPVLLVLVPPLNNAAGMIGSVFGARVSTGLHTGSLMSDGARQFRRDLVATLVIGAITFSGLALLALPVALAYGINDVAVLKGLLLIVAGSGGILLVGMSLTVIFIGSLSFHSGWDPDNVIIPVVTATGDILAVGCLVLMVQWVGL